MNKPTNTELTEQSSPTTFSSVKKIGPELRSRSRLRMSARKATPEQEKRLGEAIDLFLREWVRRKLHREGEL
jgi:hypothetical protein